MKKLLLLLAVVFSTVACENLSDELATANDRITLLEGEINSLEQQLQDSINANTITAQQLVDAQAEITALLDQLETAYEANINLGNINGELWEQLYALEAQIADLNNQISNLQGQLADALEADELNTELISSLNDQIAELEAQEPEIIIEYIETIIEVIKEVEVITEVEVEVIREVEVIVETIVEIDNTDYEAVANLQAQLDALTADAWGEHTDASGNTYYTNPVYPNYVIRNQNDTIFRVYVLNVDYGGDSDQLTAVLSLEEAISYIEGL